MHSIQTEKIAEAGSEVAALLSWKSSFDTKSQSLLSSWAGGNPCNDNWVGIGCNKVGRVVNINLTSYAITDTLRNLNFSSFPYLTSILTTPFMGPSLQKSLTFF
ncbi:hypothetical protein ACH5RR_034038 [Cinchona calisaya]|uniref:Leucine-rich repeat-containing N-terminal plant-type domain-containing protein n=1 Tax=Cinchona calisaya TaxID=153742 RepID=A0ABD2YEA3_9GENT